MTRKRKSINPRKPNGIARRGIPSDYSLDEYFRDRKAASARDWVMEDSGENDLDSETLIEARQLVRQSFEEVKAVAKREVIEPELNEFFNAVRLFENSNGKPFRTFKTADGSLACTPIIRNGSHLNGDRCKAVKVVDERNNAQFGKGCLVRTHHGVLPRARYFSFTDTNFLAPDVLRLSHIPYISDTSGEDRRFVSRLLAEYTEGIHGTTYGCGEHINDFMMWKLLEILQHNWKKDARYVFGAIFEMFPNKYSFKQLMTGRTLLKLRDRFMSYHASACLGGVNTIESLFCHRCLVYSCRNHSIIKDEEPSTFLSLKGHTEAETPCRNGCHLSASDINNVAVPVLQPTCMVQFFKARASAVKYDMCELSEQMNRMCVSYSIPSRLCREWFAMLMSFRNQQLESAETRKEGTKDAIKTVRERYKIFLSSLKKRNIEKIDNYATLQPCSHPGLSCEDAKCSCYTSGSVCTKFCRCEIACPIKFPGCACSPGQCGGALCACYLGGWECDPDTCISCNCDPTKLQTVSVNADRPLCRNISLQLKKWMKLKVGVSLVSGNGCFLVGNAKPGDLIAEYTGEILSQEETERRGLIYDKYGCSYIFQLNHKKSIDACRMGNLIRFANNDSVDPNCLAKTVVVNGEQRIGVYARKVIKDGEELFFNYNYNEDHRNEYVALSIHDVKKEKKVTASSASSAGKK